MMKALILFFIFSGTIGTVSAQLLYPEIMEPRVPLWGTVIDLQGRTPDFPTRLYGKYLANSSLQNPGIRYVVQNLKKETYADDEINAAINTLIRYAEDVRLKYVVEYLRNYTQRIMPDKEQALTTLQRQVQFDSIVFQSKLGDSLISDFDEYVNSDLPTFLNYIRTDSNYLWLRRASRDSVLLEMISAANNSIRLWINNGKMSYHRFWASNRYGDTIGSWIQVMPVGNRLKIYLDDDVYQTPTIQKKKMDTTGSIPNRPDKQFFVISPLHVGKIARRYWTYYSEVELAMSQGKLANWASGGENSLSLLSNIRYFWNYNRNKTSWENWIHYRFGFMKNGSESIRKNEDRFEFNSKLGQKAFKHWYYTAQFNVLTQLFNSYEYPKESPRELVANFMSPGYFTLSLGLDFKPNSNFSLMISPIAGKWNYVRDTARIDPQRYGVSEAGKRYKREAGAQLNLMSKLSKLFNIVDMNNELKVFMSYEKKDKYVNLGKDDEKKKRIPVTANWKMTLSFKINYFMSASIYTETIYDENYSRKIQFKENLNLGVKFRF